MAIDLTKIFENTQTYTYQEFLSLCKKLFSEGKSTSNSDKEMYVYYTGLNLKRMEQWDKTFKPDNRVQSVTNKIESNQSWIVITEAWCGDSAQILPIINKIAEITPQKIQLKVVLRDSNLELMDMFLTNGGRSIPKLLILESSTNKVLNTWGPRPPEAQRLVKEWKDNLSGKTFEQMEQELHLWYARDKGRSIVEEIIAASQNTVK